jgi:hypothetical protein
MGNNRCLGAPLQLRSGLHLRDSKVVPEKRVPTLAGAPWGASSWSVMQPCKPRKIWYGEIGRGAGAARARMAGR